MNDLKEKQHRSDLFHSSDENISNRQFYGDTSTTNNHTNNPDFVNPDSITSYDSNRESNKNNVNNLLTNQSEINDDLTLNQIKSRSNKFYEDTDEPHCVKIVVTIAASFPADTEKESIYESVNKPRATEGPKPQNFYRFEYQLMPDDVEPVIMDLVTYKIAAKLYPEKSEPRVLKTWEHQNRIWVLWSQTHELMLTKSRLLKLFDHELVLKIWDSRDYCSARTKFDKPKPFKFSSKPGENLEDLTRSAVLEQCNNYLKQIPKELHERMERKLPNQIRNLSNFNLILDPGPAFVFNQEPVNEKTSNILVAIPSRSVLSQLNTNRLNELASDTDMIRSLKHLRNNENNRPKSKMSKHSSQLLDDSKHFKRSKVKEKSKKEIMAEQEFIKKNGITRIKLKMKVLFTGDRYLISRIDDSISSIEDCLFSVNLENSLMSDEQLYDLNPIQIKLEKLTNMPNKPIGFNQLRETCEPVYCSYNFFQQPFHKTAAKPHEKTVHYNDINVYLTGLLNKQELHEFLHSTPFEIEVHDRDRKPVEKESQKACLFGSDPIDENISNVNSIASKHTIHNPFETKSKCWDPFGVAKIDLHEFVLGKKLVEYSIPVLPCPAPDPLGRNASKNSSNTKTLGNEDMPMQTAGFLESNTHLNIKISVAKPLFHPKSAKKSAVSRNTSVFARIIIRLNSKKMFIIKALIENIKRINAEALNLSQHPIVVQEAALSTYKLSEEEQKSKTLNILTGFHMINGQTHVFVLEGIKEYGIKEIYEQIPRVKNDCDCEVIYNSNMSFSNRLYSPLDVELLTIKLFEPIEEIVKKPLLYIRDMTPKSSFEALIKLYQLMSEYRLRSIVRCDLLPNADMILSMSKEFGIPLNEQETEQLKQSQQNILNSNKEFNNQIHDVNEEFGYYYVEQNNIPHTSRIWTPIDNQNEQFIKEKNEKQSQMKNFLSKNIETIHKISEKNKINKPIKKYILAEGFSYSSSTVNATEQALDKFREYINENTPNVLYSYNPEYHNSMTFVPVNIKKQELEEKQKSISEWRSKEGWVYPDVRTSMQSNQHPKKPDQACLDKINEPWEENHLHVYKMKSPLDREFYKGNLRKNDFDVWSYPKPESQVPITIFEAGIIKENREKEVLRLEKETWKNKLTVENPELKFHKLSASTESKLSGPQSSNQIDKLKGLLKDEPDKKSLLLGGVNFNNVPSLSVLKPNYEEQEAIINVSKGFKAGDLINLRITDDKNRIPLFDYERSKFQKLKGKPFESTFGPPKSPVYLKRFNSLRKQGYKDILQEDNRRIYRNAKIFIIPNKTDIELIEPLRSVISS